MTSNFSFSHSVFKRPTIFLDLSKLKVSADDEINITPRLKFVFRRVEIVGKGENAGYLEWLEEAHMERSLTLSQTSPGFFVSAVKVF